MVLYSNLYNSDCYWLLLYSSLSSLPLSIPPFSNGSPVSGVFGKSAAGQPKVHKFVSGGAGWKGGYLFRRLGSIYTHKGLFLSAEQGCFFRHVLLQ